MLSLELTFEGHRVRMAGTPERPEWVAKDCCRVLGLTTHNAGQGIPDGEKGHCSVVTPGGPQDVVTVTEGGLYRLVLRSRKPGAARFQSWLFSEVLPSIRKHGAWPPPAEPTALAVNLRDLHQLAAVALQLTEIVAEKDAAIAVLAPKAAAHDRLSVASGDVNLQEAGRLLKWGPNIFVWRLIEDGVLFRGRHGRPEPYADHLSAGWFRVVITEREGHAWAQTFVTPAGLQWLARRYQPQRELAS